jgi:hypothetical protein
MTILRQLKTKDEIANVRKQMAMKQHYLCPICGSSTSPGNDTLDHCHFNGHVRSTICRLCNRNEGKVLKAMRYMAPRGHPVWSNPIGWLRSLADYLEYHRDNPSGIIHPTFDLNTGKQKPVKRRKKKK